MPTPAQIVENVMSLALVGATGATGDTARVYRYLNVAYRELYEMVAERYPWFVQATQNVSMTAGVGTMATQPLHILSVRDANNAFAELRPTDVLAVEEKDPAMDAQGSPDEFYVNGFVELNSHPLNDTTLRVRYTPQAATLEIGDNEVAIKLQPTHHDALLWGTLKLMAYDERDKVVGAELAYNETEHEKVLDRMWRWFDAHAPKESQPVKSYVA